MDIFDDLQLARLRLDVAVNPGADRDVTKTPQRGGLAGRTRVAAATEQAGPGPQSGLWI
jgi:hypothetical protein